MLSLMEKLKLKQTPEEKVDCNRSGGKRVEREVGGRD